MPVYDYDCANCGRRFEVIHGVHADSPATCPLCGGGPVRKAITAPAVHYKGSGWAKKERRATSSPGTSKSTVDGSGGQDAGDTAGSTKDASTPEKVTSDPTTETKPEAKSSASATD